MSTLLTDQLFLPNLECLELLDLGSDFLASDADTLLEMLKARSQCAVGMSFLQSVRFLFSSNVIPDGKLCRRFSAMSSQLGWARLG